MTAKNKLTLHDTQHLLQGCSTGHTRDGGTGSESWSQLMSVAVDTTDIGAGTVNPSLSPVITQSCEQLTHCFRHIGAYATIHFPLSSPLSHTNRLLGLRNPDRVRILTMRRSLSFRHVGTRSIASRLAKGVAVRATVSALTLYPFRLNPTPPFA